MSNQLKKKWSPPSIILKAIVFFALYVLSAGPLAWINANFVPSPYEDTACKVIEIVYAPLFWLSNGWGVFGESFYWYLSLWVH